MAQPIETWRANDGTVWQTREEAEERDHELAEGRLPNGHAVRYSTNNSGGSYWLGDKEWKALEAGGWTVEWSDWERGRHSWRGAYDSVPHYAWAPVGMTEAQAKADFARLTDEDPDAQGCNCCGRPHNFSVEDAGELDREFWLAHASPDGWKGPEYRGD